MKYKFLPCLTIWKEFQFKKFLIFVLTTAICIGLLINLNGFLSYYFSQWTNFAKRRIFSNLLDANPSLQKLPSLTLWASILINGDKTVNLHFLDEIYFRYLL